MYKLLLLFLTIGALKILAIYVSIKAKTKNSKKQANQPISKPYSIPMFLFLYYFSKKHTTRQPLEIKRPKVRNNVVELKYYEVRAKLIQALKTGSLSRDEIIILRKFLEENLYEYEVKKWENDYHAIYSMLKAKDLSIEHLEAIEKFIAI